MGSNMAKELYIRAPDGTSRTIPLESGRLTVGRSRGSEISFPDDPSLSRQHFILEGAGDEWSVEDLGSKNGTQVDGTRVGDKRRLRSGSRIEAGQVLLIFDPSAMKAEDPVQFYPSGETEIPRGTVMANLKGLLSGERTPPSAAAAVGAPAQGFGGPAFFALVRAGKELSGHRPLPELFRLILQLSIDAVGAERAVLMTLEGDRLVTQASHGDGFHISSAVRDQVVEKGTSLLVTDVLRDDVWNARQSISEQQVRTMMAAPLQTEDRVIGMIYLDSRFFVREFTPDDLNLLTVLANVAATRIEQERYRIDEEDHRRVIAEIDQAAQIQRGFLPERPPQLERFDVAGHNAACRTVGGDYYDFFPYPDGRLGIVIGDVSGKGLPASLVMTGLHATVHMLAEEPGDLARLMSRLDRFVASHCPTNRFVSLFFGVLGASSEGMTYCNAGHNPPLVIRANGSVERLLPGGTVLGILPEVGYEAKRCPIESGDVVVLYSDGVTESTNPADEEFGEARLQAVLASNRPQPAARIVDAVNDAVAEWSAGAPPADDITVVVVKRL